jgi:predicted amidohydrolase
MAILTVACVQTNSGPEVAPNLETAAALVRAARGRGADLITLPENVALFEPRRAKLLEKAEPQENHAALAAFRALAHETGAWLLVGSLAVKLSADKVANRGFLLDPAGAVMASYDKIHMFDVTLPSGEAYRESATFAPGDRAVVAPTPWGKLGLSICYDVRFAALYRALAEGGAEMLAVPSAFTRTTGQAHWHVLLRARAIETGCFVIAAAQCGTHAEGRQTYGHSLIVDPWGEVLADGGEAVGVVTARIDTARVAEVRRMVPALAHGRAIPRPASGGDSTAG